MPSTTSKTRPTHSWKFDAIGTRWSVETHEPLPLSVKHEVNEYIEQFDLTYSRFRADSIVAQLSKSPGTYSLDGFRTGLAQFYRDLYDATDGAMSPLVGTSLVSAGYDMNYSLSPTSPMSATEWNASFEWNDDFIRSDQPVSVDIGAAGKGYLVDRIGEILSMVGVETYVIDASGDIMHRGDTNVVIGLENPLDPTSVVGTYPLHGASLCASAINRRSWGNGWHHMVDARTGKPVNDVLATWVIADTTMHADGFATALFFSHANRLLEICKFEYVRLFANGKIECSRDFVGELYI